MVDFRHLILVEDYYCRIGNFNDYTDMTKRTKMKSKIIKPDGTKVEVAPLNRSHFELHEIQIIVKGCYQSLYLKDKSILMVNKDGKLLGLPFNEGATKLLEGSPYAGDFICGDALHFDFDKV